MLSLTLYLDRTQWLKHLRHMEELYPDYVPVIKGNGYGFGSVRLAQEAWEAGKDKIAAGTIEEARQLIKLHNFTEILILTPVVTELRAADFTKFIFTIGSLGQLHHLLQSAQKLNYSLPIMIVFKCESTMRRYGLSPQDLALANTLVSTAPISIQIEGYALHFALERLTDRDKLSEIDAWLKTFEELGLNQTKLYISHLTPTVLQQASLKHPTTTFVMRLGTSLWLGDTSTYSFRTNVLDVKPIKFGERFGYKQKTAWRDGYLIYVSGGTANGIGMESPSHAKGLMARLKLTLFWLLSLCNFNLSPFTYKGHKLWFAEPPHMQASILKVPKKISPPFPGEELIIKNLRMTIAKFDEIVELEPQTSCN
ncbi:MAG: alanine racemase [Peptococcaceae bacterium]|nr:alanine racemase [Peptococcaceae bacterium]